MMFKDNKKLKLLILLFLGVIIIFISIKYIYREREIIKIGEMIPLSTTIREEGEVI